MIRLTLLTICLAVVASGARAQQAMDNEEQRSISNHTGKHLQKDTDRQNIHRIPFGSRGNAIRLQVVNSSSEAARDLTINANNIPGWMELTPTSFAIGDLPADKSATASFTFHVGEEAPVGKKATLRFLAEGADGYRWEKQVALTVSAPTEVRLKQNYPNPFNPSTTIAYQLPARMEVTITVYNILGQRIVTLANGVQDAGRQTVRWDASRFASGLYFYRIIADAPGMEKIVQHKKMLLIK